MVTKAANPMAIPSASSLDPGFIRQERVKQDAAQHIVALPLTMLALGALARGALGVRDLLSPSHLPRNPSRVRPIGMPGNPAEEDEKIAADALDPSGHLSFEAPKNFALGLIRPLVQRLYNVAADTPEQFRNPANSVWNAWKGNMAKTVGGVPAAGLAIPLGVAGLATGYGLTDRVLDAKQDAERKHELKQLRDEFQSTISKSAAEQLDNLAEAQTAKQADAKPLMQRLTEAAPDTVGWGVGIQNATALTSALLAGKLSYDFFKERSRRKILDEAMKRRSAQRNQAELTPAYVVPMG